MRSTLSAIAFICLCKLVFSIQDVIIKEMSGSFPVHEIMVVRSVISIVLLLGVLYFSEGPDCLKNRRIWPPLFRGALLFGSFTLFYLGLSSMPLTVATVLFFTAPFFITVLSIPILGESVGIRRWCGILAGFLGVLIILRPSTTSFGIEGLLPVASAFFYAIAQLMARKLGITESAAVMTLFANISYLVLGLSLALITLPFEPPPDASSSISFLLRPWILPVGRDAVFVALTGVTGAVGFWLSTQAYRISEVNRIAPFEYVMLIWVPILSYLMWQQLPDGMTIFGTAIIAGAGLYVVRRDETQTRRPMVSKGLSRTR
jgi:drug/metabolite transporter (DMT)-like permease